MAKNVPKKKQQSDMTAMACAGCKSCSQCDPSGFHSDNPGRDTQKVGTARFLHQNPANVHYPVWAVTGSLGDSQCYLGVSQKVEAIQRALSERIRNDGLPVRLIYPAYTVGVSDGQLNGTSNMRFSLIGREVTNETIDLHLSGSDINGCISVVACDKPPVGTLAALLEHNNPAVLMSDGSIHPGTDPDSGERIDIVTAFQLAGDPDQSKRDRVALHACCGTGSCGGMFTYNTMQSFFGAIGMEPLQMVSPASDDDRRLHDFPEQLIDCLLAQISHEIRPRDIVTPQAIRNGIITAIALGGSTNVMLHSVEIARAAGLDFWRDVMTQKEFNSLSRTVPVLVNVRPFGSYSMIDIDSRGGIQVVINELLRGGLLDPSCMTCTGETLAQQIKRLNPPPPDHQVIFSLKKPFKPSGGLRLLKGNLAPKGGAIIKIAGIEGGLKNGKFTGKARVFNSEAELLAALSDKSDSFQDNDMVVIRYEGPRGAPGMPELLDPTSRITTLCRQKGITIALMTDARFSGGSVGLVIGHVAPEAYLGGPIALVRNGDTIVVDINNDTLDCLELNTLSVLKRRKTAWKKTAAKHGNVHPDVQPVTNRLLKRMRATARPALEGSGMAA